MLRGHAYVRNGARAATVSVHHQREGEFKSHVAASRHLAIGRDSNAEREARRGKSFRQAEIRAGPGLEKELAGREPGLLLNDSFGHLRRGHQWASELVQQLISVLFFREGKLQQMDNRGLV